LDETAFEACLTGAVENVVKRQADVGIDIVSDGEFGKSISWANYIHPRMRGIEFRQGGPPANARLAPLHFINSKDRKDFRDFYTEYESQFGIAGMSKNFSPTQMGFPVVTGPISYSPEQIRSDLARLKAAMAKTSGGRGFMPVVVPVSAAIGVADAHYRDHESFLYAIADALHDEYQAIVDAGFDVQIDDAYIASEYDGMIPPGTLDDFRRWADAGVAALNHALRGIPEERVRYHICWGS
jgi:5-methyltetrahydropteroyltriglutamate--homocysteine methyltransferase